MGYEGLDEVRASSFGVPVEEYKKVLRKHGHDFQIGATEPEINARMALDLGGKGPNEPYVKSFTRIYKPNTPLIEFLREIRNRGYPIALATNTELPLIPFINAQDYPIDVLVASCEIGARKPDVRFYEAIPEAFRKAGINVKKEEIFFFDDDIDCVAGARDSCMPAEQYINNKQIIEVINGLIKR